MEEGTKLEHSVTSPIQKSEYTYSVSHHKNGCKNHSSPLLYHIIHPRLPRAACCALRLYVIIALSATPSEDLPMAAGLVPKAALSHGFRFKSS